MILPRYSQILISSAVVVVSVFSLSDNPLLAHSGHNHDSSNQKDVVETKEKEPSNRNSKMDSKLGEKSSSQPSTNNKSAPISEGSMVTDTTSEPSLIILNLQPGEWVFILLMTSPLGLFFLKRWIHRGKFGDT